MVNTVNQTSRNHRMIFDMSDVASDAIASAIAEAYKNEKFAHRVSCKMETTDGNWSLYIQSNYPGLLLEFSAHMHFAMPGEPEVPTNPYQPVTPAVHPGQEAAHAPQHASSAAQEVMAAINAPHVPQEAAESAPLAESEEVEPEEIEEDDEDVETESEEDDAEETGSKSREALTIRLPKGNKRVQRTGHSAVTIEG